MNEWFLRLPSGDFFDRRVLRGVFSGIDDAQDIVVLFEGYQITYPNDHADAKAFLEYAKSLYINPIGGVDP